jgi:hypothetical protein
VGDLANVVIAICAVAGLVVSLMNRRKIQIVHLATNSMKDELVALTAKSSRAEGVKQGQAEGLAEGRAEVR